MAGKNQLPGDESDDLVAEINITPFVDVVLVLLVIFIVTAPALVKDVINIKLPKAASADGSKIETIGIAVNASGQILLNGQVADKAAVQGFIRETLRTNPQAQAVLSADRDAKHGDVVTAIDWVKEAGIDRFAIQIEKSK